MEHQKPIHLTLDFLNGIGVAANNDYAFINREMGIVSSMCGMTNRLFKTGQPYRAKEVRIFHVQPVYYIHPTLPSTHTVDVS